LVLGTDDPHGAHDADYAVSSFIPKGLTGLSGISLAYGAIGLLWSKVSGFGEIKVRDLDWNAVFLLGGCLS
jgi:hypothetical protein